MAEVPKLIPKEYENMAQSAYPPGLIAFIIVIKTRHVVRFYIGLQKLSFLCQLMRCKPDSNKTVFRL